MKVMKAAVFDTNILIDFANAHEEARAIIRRCDERMISVITWVEFLTGVPYPKMEEAKAFLSDMFDIIYPDEEIYNMALDIRREKRLKLPDATIHATAKHLNVPLVTRNTKDFDETMPDICVPYDI